MVTHTCEDYSSTFRVYWVNVNDKIVEFSLEDKKGTFLMKILQEPDLETWELVAFQDELKKCILEYKQHLLKYLWN